MAADQRIAQVEPSPTHSTRWTLWRSRNGIDPRGLRDGAPDDERCWVNTLKQYCSYVRAGGWNEGQEVKCENVITHLNGIVRLFQADFRPSPLEQRAGGGQ